MFGLSMQNKPAVLGELLIMTVSLTASAQVTLDGSLGRSGALTGPNYPISADLGQQLGGNLFHSFGQFSIQSGEIATFSGPNSVSNIIGRVTGGQLSSIDGTLRSTIPNANLYLINPAGVLFKEHAQIDVSGSFHVSTADYLRLGDGGRFDVRTPGNSVLTVAPVEAFGFVGDAPGKIEISGSFLRVHEGQTLSVIGGDISLNNATLYAPAGRINLVSVASAGEVIPIETDLQLHGFAQLGDLDVSRDPSAPRLIVDNHALGDLDTSGEGGGAMVIRGENLQAQGGWLLADTYGDQDGIGIDLSLKGNVALTQGGFISTAAWGAGDGGSITLSANNLLIDPQQSLNYTGLISSVRPTAAGTGGAVNLHITDTLSLLNGGKIHANTAGTGDAGEIAIGARHVLMRGLGGTSYDSSIYSEIASRADWGSRGQGGAIHIRVADTLTLQSTAVINASTSSVGRAGVIDIDAGNLLLDAEGVPIFMGIDNSAGVGATGAGGNIDIRVADALIVKNSGQIRTSTWSSKPAGDVSIHAHNLLVDGGGTWYFTGIFSDVKPSAAGQGGTINLEVTDTLSVFSAGQIRADTQGSGSAGAVALNADHLLVDGQQSLFPTGITSSAGLGSTGTGGEVNLRVADTVTLTNGGQINARTDGANTAGNINIHAGRVMQISGGSLMNNVFSRSGVFVSADSAKGQAGAVTMTTPELNLSDGGGIYGTSTQTSGGDFTLNADHLKLLNGSEISTSVFGDVATEGGNVQINSRNIVALDGSKVTAQAKQGRGGNITVNADVFLHNAPNVEAVLNASSEVSGNDGTVQNNAPTSDISGSLVAMNASYLDVAGQLRPGCVGGKFAEERNRFIVQGRGALPPEPDGALSVSSRCMAESGATIPPAARVSPAEVESGNWGDH